MTSNNSIPRWLIVALFAVVLAACAPTRTTKSAGEQVDDSVVTARVKTALAKGLGTGDSIRADVETFRGRVQLNGFVDSPEKKSEATRIARAVEGVTAVDNNLRVATEGRSAGEFLDDNIITAKVKAALAADPDVKAHEVNLAVRQGVVQLAGFVETAAQKQQAERLASQVNGVKSVDNQISIKQR
jgi:hyperosmotically inducible periplasmic protein